MKRKRKLCVWDINWLISILPSAATALDAQHPSQIKSKSKFKKIQIENGKEIVCVGYKLVDQHTAADLDAQHSTKSDNGPNLQIHSLACKKKKMNKNTKKTNGYAMSKVGWGYFILVCD